ncbi:MAG: invasin domain 3-containing protein [Ignavibacteriaceae bacterium]
MFNDWKDSLFAVVDPFLSEIIVEPDSIPADGTSQAIITISPKNNSDTLLASGLQVLLSNTGAGFLSSVNDLGDGTYQASITAPIATGTDTISATVLSGNDTVSVFTKAVLTYVNATSIDESLSSLEKFYLFQNSPNPFNPTTKIKYQIPRATYVLLKVFDVIGNEVSTLVNGEKQAGIHEVEFNSSKLSSGVYIYQLRAGNFLATKKMILTK